MGSVSPHAACISQLVVPMTGVPKTGCMPGPRRPALPGSLIATRAGWNLASLPAGHLLCTVVFGQSLWLLGKECAQSELTLGSQSPQLLGKWMLLTCRDTRPFKSVLCVQT